MPPHHGATRYAPRPWAYLYKSARWSRIRAAQLAATPLCEPCAKATPPRVTPATTVHHVIPHKGDPTIFHTGPFESHCKACHDAIGAEQDRQGYHSLTDAQGYPIDPRHPFNAQ